MLQKGMVELDEIFKEGHVMAPRIVELSERKVTDPCDVVSEDE